MQKTAPFFALMEHFVEFGQFSQMTDPRDRSDREERGCIDEKPNFFGAFSSKKCCIKRGHNFGYGQQKSNYSQEYTAQNRVWKTGKILMNFKGFSQFPQVFPQGDFGAKIYIFGLHKKLWRYLSDSNFFCQMAN